LFYVFLFDVITYLQLDQKAAERCNLRPRNRYIGIVASLVTHCKHAQRVTGACHSVIYVDWNWKWKSM